MLEDEFMYEVYSNHGTVVFHSEEDAINALWMVGLYHGITIDREKVKRDLNQDRHYDYYPRIKISETSTTGGA